MDLRQPLADHVSLTDHVPFNMPIHVREHYGNLNLVSLLVWRVGHAVIVYISSIFSSFQTLAYTLLLPSLSSTNSTIHRAHLFELCCTNAIAPVRKVKIWPIRQLKLPLRVPLIHTQLHKWLLPAFNPRALLLLLDLQHLALLGLPLFTGTDPSLLLLQTKLQTFTQLPHSLCPSLSVPFGRTKRSTNLSSSGVKVFLGLRFPPIFLEKQRTHAASVMNATWSASFNRASDWKMLYMAPWSGLPSRRELPTSLTDISD